MSLMNIANQAFMRGMAFRQDGPFDFSNKAEKASDKANKSKDPEDHKAAADSHKKAATLHSVADNKKEVDYHNEMARAHGEQCGDDE